VRKTEEKLSPTFRKMEKKGI